MVEFVRGAFAAIHQSLRRGGFRHEPTANLSPARHAMSCSARKRSAIVLSLLATLVVSGSAGSACDLCAIYNAGSTRGETAGGFLFSIAEQFIPFRTEQFKSDEVATPNPDYLDRSV